MIPEAPREHEETGAASRPLPLPRALGRVYGRSLSSPLPRVELRCFETAWRSKYSIWPFTLRSSSPAHRSISFQSSGGSLRRNALRSSATGRPIG